ncbi:MAG: RDD family protein [Cyanobacteria bacterium P01_H01_bin.130]
MTRDRRPPRNQSRNQARNQDYESYDDGYDSYDGPDSGYDSGYESGYEEAPPPRRSPRRSQERSRQRFREQPPRNEPRNELSYIPRSPMWRRGVATAIDAIGCCALGSMLGPAPHVALFVVLWWLVRVAMVANNRGQSFGRLAMDIKVIEGQDFDLTGVERGRFERRSPRIPTLLELTKREAIVGGEALLGFIALELVAQINPAALLAAAPVVADYVIAATDLDRRQALHDRVIDSIVVQTSRGLSLHIKGRRWFNQLLDQSERFMGK